MEEEKIKIIDIPCRFSGENHPDCALVCGQITLPIEDPRNSIDDFPDHQDTRCAYHEGVHGNFKDMSERFMNETGGTMQDFLDTADDHEFKSELVEGLIESMNMVKNEPE